MRIEFEYTLDKRVIVVLDGGVFRHGPFGRRRALECLDRLLYFYAKKEKPRDTMPWHRAVVAIRVEELRRLLFSRDSGVREDRAWE